MRASKDDVPPDVVPGAAVADDGSLEFSAQVAHMEELAAKYIPDEPGANGRSQRESFLMDVTQLVGRTSQEQTWDEANPLTQQQVIDTFAQIERLLTADSVKISQETGDERAWLAEQILDHAAAPDQIDQGQHPTCVLTDIESIMYTDDPAEAARMVVDAALNGSVNIAGDEVHIPAPNLIPEGEATINPPLDTQRDFASQLFQSVVANDIGQHQDSPKYFATIGQEDDSGKFPEYWTDADGTPLTRARGKNHANEPGTRLDRFRGLTSVQMAEELARLTGKENAMLIFGHRERPDMATFNTEEEFRQILTDLAATGGFPVAVGVTSKDEVFDGADTPGEKRQQNHVVLIREYDTEVDYLWLDNTWGNERDFWITPTEMFKATRRHV